MSNLTRSIKTKREFNKHVRRLKALLFAIRYPAQLKRAIQSNVCNLYEYGCFKSLGISSISPEKIINSGNKFSLLNPSVRNGNVSYFELFILVSIVAAMNPKNLLEIGTFDGNTTLQLAINASASANVHTIDLPDEGAVTDTPILQDDLAFVFDEHKKMRKYLNSPVEDKVVQHFGDSTNYDFGLFCKKGPIDFCFIDGGHSYECVKSDTENVLKVISQDAVVLWHDYNPNCPGVFKFLNELSSNLPLKHIIGTSLVIHCRETSQSIIS